MPTHAALDNINIGLMGHVDAGKTTLARLLSTHASTACFDRSPQSQSRGITLDLGFSSLSISSRQFTLVDCPGHATLLRTVLCASAIIDAVILVVGPEGIQTQTAECLVLAECTTERLLIALTKMDLFQEPNRSKKIEELTIRIGKILASTRFKEARVIPVSPFIDGSRERFLRELDQLVPDSPIRDPTGPALVAIDHCFTVKGHGPVMTGTVLQGTISIGDKLGICSPQSTCKIKTIQSYKRSMNSAIQGDRVGLGVTGLVSVIGIERALLSVPGYQKLVDSFIMAARPIRYYKYCLISGVKLHVSILHQTTMGILTFYRVSGEEGEFVDTLDDRNANVHVLVRLATRVVAPPGSAVLVSKLDDDLKAKTCRIALHGHVLSVDEPKIFRWKFKRGTVQRTVDDHRLIGYGLSPTLSGLQRFLGMECHILSQDGSHISTGRIQSPFGTTGKFNIILNYPSGVGDYSNAIVECRIKTFTQ
jgi:selenocysteine-specific elongation factor